MKNLLRILIFIPASILAFLAILFLGMVLFDFVGKVLNFSSTFGGLINNRNTPNNTPGITVLLSMGIGGMFASWAYFAVGKWILPNFDKPIYTKISLYSMVIVIGIALILFSVVAYLDGNIISAIGYSILLIELVIVFLNVQDFH